jgi:aspartate kinase
VVVSAENGVTDALLATARDIVRDPDPVTLDLLWSTGETHAVAVLTLHLQALGVRAIAANVHQTGLTGSSVHGRLTLRPLRLRSLFADHDVVVAPGFLARASGDGVVSLGRGGSDLTAVLLAAGLDAHACELVKDVPGYFTADPKRDPDARPIGTLSYESAIGMADAGCALVQRQALVAARDRGLPLVIRAIGTQESTIVGEHCQNLWS